MAKQMGWNDTIVALATPQGLGAIGVIRLSGNKAIEIVNLMFPSKNLLIQATHTLHVGLLKNNGEVLDEVVVGLYKNPKSYTGEDVVEISCHGSAFIQEKLFKQLYKTAVELLKLGSLHKELF
jgi:tRNA modification GTPase